MALIKCSECGNDVSDKAKACPNCGCPVKAPIWCPECNSEIKESDTTCSNCGFPLKKGNTR